MLHKGVGLETIKKVAGDVPGFDQFVKEFFVKESSFKKSSFTLSHKKDFTRQKESELNTAIQLTKESSFMRKDDALFEVIMGVLVNDSCANPNLIDPVTF